MSAEHFFAVHTKNGKLDAPSGPEVKRKRIEATNYRKISEKSSL
jgi:hypothetical protein